MTVYSDIRIDVDSATTVAIPYGGGGVGKAGFFKTKPANFGFNDSTNTLSVTNLSILNGLEVAGDLTVDGDLLFDPTDSFHQITAAQAAAGLDGTDFLMKPGKGGNANTTNDAGDGGSLQLTGNAGGAASATHLAGDGGAGELFGGTGGAGSAAHPSGPGGDTTVRAGNAGADGGGGGNDGGDTTIEAGGGVGAGVNGDVNIGPVNAANVNIGNATANVNIDGTIRPISGSIIFDKSAALVDIEQDAETTPGGAGNAFFQSPQQGGPADASVAGGDGGDWVVFGANGGAGSAAHAAGGGGDLQMLAGDAGVAGAGGGNNGGNVALDAGVKTGAGTNGSVDIGTNAALHVALGRLGATGGVIAKPYLQIPVLGADPAVPPANNINVYCKLVAGVVKLHIQNSAGVVQVVTSV